MQCRVSRNYTQTTLKRLTSISDQQRYQVCLVLAENCDEFLEIGDASASKKLEQLIVAVTWLWNIRKMFSLRPRDTPGSSKLSDKRNISLNTIQ